MNEKDNPYFNLLEIMNNQSPKQQSILHYGKVVSINPIQIKLNEIILDQEDLKINSSLKFYDGTIPRPIEMIDINDSVILLSEDYQTYILLCKVV